MRYFTTIMQSNMLYKEQLNSYQEFEQSIVIALSNNDRIFYRTFNDFNNSNTKYETCLNFSTNYRNVVRISNPSLYILSLSFFRQLGCRNSTKLVPLVQELGQQIHLFLAEYNRYNSDANLHVNGHSNLNICENLEGANEADATPHINLPGFRRRNKNKW